MRSRSLIFTVGGLAAAAIVAAIAYWFLVVQPRGAPPASVVTATVAPTPAAEFARRGADRPAQRRQADAAAAAPSPASTPAFDVVRVEPSGDAVIAGRAAPGAQVELSDDGKTIGDVAANDAGQFVILPPPLSARTPSVAPVGQGRRRRAAGFRRGRRRSRRERRAAVAAAPAATAFARRRQAGAAADRRRARPRRRCAAEPPPRADRPSAAAERRRATPTAAAPRRRRVRRRRDAAPPPRRARRRRRRSSSRSPACGRSIRPGSRRSAPRRPARMSACG